ncbi:MATE family efflux transporter [Alkalihalophilus lindianensis]|uniref:Probable multidrug resistance protein NorM n=1 Tax=Alkalihalophilus lindianensis TaxID=1630542 RepID=A0ABU3XDN1_9BACI|nr:MATE family efflux transporter [Alkalihalophilus lindianensis]MDV2685996.1 MATE family efflux transporter [Alkalihalophilus lindianensis]
MGHQQQAPALSGQPSLSNKQYLTLAIPLTISTMTTPLLGAVDTAVVGHLPDPAYIGGVAVGSLLFNTLYWVLGFLRVSTSGFTAQAYGACNEKELFYSFIRPLLIAVLFGLLFIVLQDPIKIIAMQLIQPTASVAEQAMIYVDIRIYGAPFALVNYVILGWLIGSSHVRMSLYLQVGMNVCNIFLNLFFVHGLKFGVAGVATASLIAEIGAAVVGIILLYKLNVIKRIPIEWRALWEKTIFMKMVKVNRDLFIRTVCLLVVFTLFTSKGAQMGDTLLAANAILFQLHFMMAYCLDGFANANSILVGRSVGEKSESLYRQTLKQSFKWGSLITVATSLIVLVSSPLIWPFFTSIVEVQVLLSQYLVWVVLFPVLAAWGLQLNGVFSGATEAAPVRNSLIISMMVFLVSIYFLIPSYQNHGLWISFLLFTLARTLVLSAYLPSLTRCLFKSD